MDGAAGQPEAVEGLGRGDLVDQVEVDEEEVGLVGAAGVDDVAVPDLLGEGARLGHRAQAPIFDDLDPEVPPGRGVLDRVADGVADEGLAQRRAGETTVRSPWRSSMEPTKKSAVSSSSSPS